MNGQRVESSLRGKSSCHLPDIQRRGEKKNTNHKTKKLPTFICHLAAANNSSLKEDDCVLELALENNDKFWNLEERLVN